MLKFEGNQKGLTLVELMIASVIGVVALAALLTVYGATSLHSTRQLENAHLQQQLRSILYLVSRDVRRAGFWHFNPAVEYSADNPFQSSGNRLRTGSFGNTPANSCLLFSYDLDKDGKVGIGQCKNNQCTTKTDMDNVEQFGFRLHQGAVQSRYGGQALSCNSGYWQALNDTSVTMTALRFTLSGHCINVLHSRQQCTANQPQLIQTAVLVELSGQLSNYPKTALTLKHWIKLRNDYLKDPHP